jgi:formylglycine-generating enzyme required for sulfatase activity
VTLRDFAQSVDVQAEPTAATLWTYIEREVVGKIAPESAEALQALADDGRLLYLLDGLDEVPQERRAFVRDAIDRFAASSLPSARFILTCRILSYADPVYRVPAFVDHTIASLAPEQIAQFIEAWYTALIASGSIAAETARQRVADLNDAIDVQGLSELAENPMLLTVMALVHNHLGTLPRETARLYSACVDLLLLKWRPHDARALIEQLGIREDDLLRLVWEIAFDAHDRQGEREGTADIEQHAVEMIARRFLNDDAAKGQAFCDYVEKRAGLLIGRGFDRYGARIYTFPHRTFQEFLAGCHLSVNRFARAAADYAQRGTAWREVLLLATGNLVFNNRNIDTPVDAVVRILDAASPRASDEQWRLYPMAGEMLLLVGVDNLLRDTYGTRALNDNRAGMAALLEGGHLPSVERAAAGRSLSRLGDLRPGVGLRPDGLPDIAWADEIQPGKYSIGEPEQSDNPPREIEIRHPYRVSKYLITQAQYLAFQDDGSKRGYTCPEWWEGLAADEDDKQPAEPAFRYDNHPMEQVNWYQAVAFCRWLTEKARGILIPENAVIRLPHEYEWEVAARGTDGRTYSYRGDFDPKKANTLETGIGHTSAVGIFPDGVSPCGAFDMTGNVWEWCRNKYGEPDQIDVDDSVETRVLRGGSWYGDVDYARAVPRGLDPPANRNPPIGFRVVVAFVPSQKL